MVDSKINSFEDLTCWQDAIELAIRIYKISQQFPSGEQFGITSQVRKASSSVSANIAEGFGRQGQKEKLQFYSVGYGSLLELKSFLYLCEKLGYISKEQLSELSDLITILQKKINALKRSIQNV